MNDTNGQQLRVLPRPTNTAEILRWVANHEDITDRWLVATVPGYQGGDSVQKTLRGLAEWFEDNQEAADASWEHVRALGGTDLEPSDDDA